METGLRVLRAKVKGLHGAGGECRRRIQKTSGLKRHACWQQKHALGVYSRYYQVAYGLLRGVAYERIERCSENNRLDPVRLFELMKVHAPWELNRELTLDRVKVLLGATQRPSTAQPPSTARSHTDRARALLESAGAR